MDTQNANQSEVATGNKVGEETPRTPDCPYCGQVGGVSQFDSICGEHGPAEGYVSKDGKFTPATK